MQPTLGIVAAASAALRRSPWSLAVARAMSSSSSSSLPPRGPIATTSRRTVAAAAAGAKPSSSSPSSATKTTSTPSSSKAASSSATTTLVIVESPAKARKIQQYLGSSAKVLATFGHVRDLPAKAGSVDPTSGFEMRWATPSAAASKRLDELAEVASHSKTGKVVLATDPDREGEAISWHVLEELRARGASLEEKGGGEFGEVGRRSSKKSSPKSNPIVSVERATFTSVTEAAVRAALASPRAISRDLVEAYFARRALDYLFGFSLSPLLWRRVPGARSAGRVQSAALALVANREAEVRSFVPVDYFTVEATLETSDFPPFLLEARLKRQPFGRGVVPSPGLPLASLADDAVDVLRDPGSKLVVSSVKSRPSKRSPPPPFATASLQQAASALLGMSPTDTMRAAQALYEGGDEAGGEALITYHRTDGVGMPPEASQAVREAAVELFGVDSVPGGSGGETRQWKTKAKNAQEAHEAIRPTDPRRTPQSLSSSNSSISPKLLRLYELVWRRTLASQMADARLETVTVDVGVELEKGGKSRKGGEEGDKAADGGSLRATATVVTDPGFSLAYSPLMFRGKAAAALSTEDEGDGEGEDEGDEGGETKKKKAPVVGREGELPASASSAALLSSLKPGDPLTLQNAAATKHATRPPPRFSEATLVAALEAAGVGRPSTYAPTARLLVERGYVVRDASSSGRRLAPSPLGAVLAEYLRTHFGGFVAADYTSGLEEALDEVAAGRSGWKSVLGDFWQPLEGAVEAAGKVTTREVIDELDASLGDAILRAEAKVRLAREAKTGEGIESAAEAVPASESELNAAVEAARLCPSCGGRLGLKLASGSGGFFGCSGYPSCKQSRPLWVEAEGGSAGAVGRDGSAGDAGGAFGPSSPSPSSPLQPGQSLDLGSHPVSGLPVSLRQGPYGPYVQLGEQPERTAEERGAAARAAGPRGTRRRASSEVRRVSLPRGLPASSVDLGRALALLAFPRDLGPAPPPSFWPRPRAAGKEEGDGGGEESGGGASSGGGSSSGSADGPSPSVSPSLSLPAEANAADHGTIQVAAGPYGYYIRLSGGEGGDGGAPPLSLSAPLPAGTDPAAVSFEEAVALLSARAARGASSRGKKGASSSLSAAKNRKKEPKEKKAPAAAAETEAKQKKRPPTAYQLFCAAERPSLSPGTKPTAAMAELAARWRALGESGQRGPFEAAAAEAKAKEGGSGEKAAARSKGAAAAAPSADAKKAKKRPPSAYILFCAAERPSALAALPSGCKPSSVLAELGSRWRGLGEVERGRFAAEAAAAAAAAAAETVGEA